MIFFFDRRSQFPVGKTFLVNSRFGMVRMKKQRRKKASDTKRQKKLFTKSFDWKWMVCIRKNSMHSITSFLDFWRHSDSQTRSCRALLSATQKCLFVNSPWKANAGFAVDCFSLRLSISLFQVSWQKNSIFCCDFLRFYFSYITCYIKECVFLTEKAKDRR